MSMTHEEIGQLLGISRSRVWQIEQRAIHKLKMLARKHGVKFDPLDFVREPMPESLRVLRSGS